MRRAPITLLLGLGLLVACDHGAPTKSAPDAAPAAPSASASAPELPAPTVADLDVAALSKALRCAAGAEGGACRVLDAMRRCHAWSATTPSGEGRYIGRGWVVQDGSSSDEITIVRAHTAARSELASWMLPLKMAIARIPPDAGPAFAQATKAIDAYARHDVPKVKNAAVDFLKQKSDWPAEVPAVRTTGVMVQTFSGRPAFLCEGPDQQLVLVQPHAGAANTNGNGLYVELWAASW
jgi:hypothetical protein